MKYFLVINLYIRNKRGTRIEPSVTPVTLSFYSDLNFSSALITLLGVSCAGDLILLATLYVKFDLKFSLTVCCDWHNWALYSDHRKHP